MCDENRFKSRPEPSKADVPPKPDKSKVPVTAKGNYPSNSYAVAMHRARAEALSQPLYQFSAIYRCAMCGQEFVVKHPAAFNELAFVQHKAMLTKAVNQEYQHSYCFAVAQLDRLEWGGDYEPQPPLPPHDPPGFFRVGGDEPEGCLSVFFRLFGVVR